MPLHSVDFRIEFTGNRASYVDSHIKIEFPKGSSLLSISAKITDQYYHGYNPESLAIKSLLENGAKVAKSVARSINLPISEASLMEQPSLVTTKGIKVIIPVTEKPSSYEEDAIYSLVVHEKGISGLSAEVKKVGNLIKMFPTVGFVELHRKT